MTKLREQMNKYEPSNAVKNLNPEIYGLDTKRLDKWKQNTLQIKGIEKFKTAWSDKEPSSLEEKFMKTWEKIGGIPYLRECKCLESHKYRWDFCFPERKFAIEVHGMSPKAGCGGHQSFVGVTRDCLKQTLATLDGWRIAPLTGQHITEEILQKINNFLVNLPVVQ